MPDTAPPPVVMFDRVTVTYGNQQALREVTGGFAAGAAGLLGPNGAGKSTLLKSLLGFVRPTAGSMRVLGLDVAAKPLEVRARLGYMPESDAHIPAMNAVTFVAYCARLAGLPLTDATQRAHEVLFYVGLGEARYRDIGTYSTGMRQRIKLAQALVHDPDLLFLDEPTNGMDPQGRDEMLELMRDITQNKGINLILSSHLLADVEATCERVLVLNKGAIVAEGPIQELKGTTRRAFEIRIKGNLERFRDALAVAGLECDETLDDVMRVRISDDRGAKDLFALAAANDAQVRHLRPFVSTLEDVFARAIGEE